MRGVGVGRQASGVRTSDDRCRRRAGGWARNAAALIGLGACVTSLVFAQDSTGGAIPDSAGAACATRLRPVGSAVDTVYASLQVTGKHPLPSAYSNIMLRGLAEYFVLPSPLGVPVFGARGHKQQSDSRRVQQPVAEPESLTVAFSGEVVFTLKRDGSLSDVRLDASSLSPSLDNAMLHAATALDSAHALPPFPDSVKADAITVFFAIDGSGDSTRVSRPLFAATMPVWTAEPMKHATGMRPNRKPRYPPLAERERIPGSVLISFVIDAQGIPRMETVRLLRASAREFAAAVLDALPNWRFVPARIDGCPVPELVQMPFAFRVP